MHRVKSVIATTSLISLFLFVSFGVGRITNTSSASAQAQSSSLATEVPVITTFQPDPKDEPTLAVSRTNSQIIVGASKYIEGGASGGGNTRVAYYFSSDGGHTWGNGVVPLETPERTWDRSSSPSIATDLNGNFYLCVTMLDNAHVATGVYVFKSTDNGHTFQNPILVTFDESTGSTPKQAEQCRMTVDVSPTSPFKNSLYVAWVSNEEPVRTVVLFSLLRPGQTSFSTPLTVSHQGGMQGPSLATGPNGEVYGAWEGIGINKIIFINVSLDGGESFLPPALADGTDIRLFWNIGSLSLPNPALNIFPVPRMNSYPLIEVDRSNGPNRGKVYIAFDRTVNGIDADISLMSLNFINGKPFATTPLQVNDPVAGADQFFPWISVDQSNGDVEVAFYDRRNNPSGNLVDVYLARSTDGGNNFEPNQRITSVGSDPRIQSDVNQIGFGDYIGLLALDGKAHLMWTDTRRGAQEVFYSQLEITPSSGGGGGGTGGGGTGGGGTTGPANDDCQTPHVISALPFLDAMDTRQATTAASDPATCGSGQKTNSVWYSITPTVNTTIGLDTSASDFDTVLSVYTGSCGSLTSVACNDNFANDAASPNRALLAFQANAGTTYLIEVSGKGSGGTLRLKAGDPVITGVEYVTASDDTESLRITGAGFTSNTTVTVNKAGKDVPMTTVTGVGQPQGDGTFSQVLATVKKLRKTVKPGKTVTVTVTVSGRVTNVFSFTR